MEYTCDIYPAGTKIGTGQCIQVLSFGGVATVCHQVNFQETRLFLVPFGESPYEDQVFEQVPGLVVLKPCRVLKRIGRKQRSMLEELIFKSSSLASGVGSISSQRSSTRMASGKNGCRRLEQIRP
jgi:hypothetical protein